ncbi:elongation of very long chain fatty acids protein 7-like isoform X1 [Leguminivora glycinivorella]|uniref:elongation of very long chain fatty acids protein 7-like isoform X1 n=1 Tax=Leguminivora glycinivorella TaxID=1035111 RepID=UPI0020100715|nr:elongation of very long chain fatty acids protein 7-like isoform X1 [Leguminivora glycinivorella]
MDWFKGAVDYVDDWFLMRTPWPLFALWLAYISFVLKVGPSYMSTRPPYKLTSALALYNLFQVGLSCYIVYMGTYIMSKEGLVSSHCAIEAKDTQPYMVRGVYIYFLAKISELLDTVFFVLRKKMNQVSFLHVYHHSLMAISTWFALKYNPTDVLIFLGTLNSFVHVVMYGYYGLSAYPSMTKYLWWKKYITSFQLIQFGLITIQVTLSALVSNCKTSYVLLFTIFFNLGLMIYLFRDFYIKAYTVKKTIKSNEKKKVTDNKKDSKGYITSIVNNDVANQTLKVKGM